MAAKILALLEHPEAMELVAGSLEHFGHIVYKADKFQDAMEILRHSEVDLIIGDVHLQNGGSIFDFLRWSKAIRTSTQFHLFASAQNRQKCRNT